MRIGEPLRQDLRYAWRLMTRSPAFTLAILLTLGLGVGANTAIFTLVNAVLLESLPVHEPERLVVLERVSPRGDPTSMTYPLYERLRDDVPAFVGVFAAQNDVRDVSVREAPQEEIAVQLVSGEYFDVLGARPLAGRTFTRDVNRKPASADAHVAVLSHAFWQRRFRGETSALGQTITLNDRPVTIVGVMRPEFFGELVGRAPDAWLPLTLQPHFDRGTSYLDDPNVGWLNAMGRLAPDVRRDRALAAIEVARARWGAESSGLGKAMRHVMRIDVRDGARGLADLRERFSRSLQILTVVVGLVLLITCANVSNLLLARATARQREVAVRLAIGAGRWRLMRQFLTESALLALGGAAVGLLLAWWGSRVLVLLVSTDTNPIAIDVTPDVRILAFTLAVSLTAAILFGLAPALRAARLDVAAAFVLRTSAGGRSRIQPVLVVTQVALSLVLLTGAALFVRTLHNLRTADLGFTSEMILQAHIAPHVSGYTREQIPDLSRRILDRLTTMPGVRAASVAGSGFGTGTSTSCCIAIEGFAHQAGEDRQVRTNSAAAGYFRAMNMPLRLGRDFEPRDDPGQRAQASVAIVNDAFARRYYGRENPVGRRFGWGNPPKVTYRFEIVGVVADASDGDVRGGAKPMIYFPSASGTLFVVRAAGAPEALVGAVRREIQAVDPKLESAVMTIAEVVERGLVREKLLAKLSSVFGVLAAALAALGLYALVAYGVVTRTRDIGIRMALGAQRGQVLRAELRAALWLVAIGLAAGVPAAILAGRLIASQLFGVTVGDPLTLASTVLLLALVAAPAAYLPARRASRVEPWRALRSE